MLLDEGERQGLAELAAKAFPIVEWDGHRLSVGGLGAGPVRHRGVRRRAI